MNDTSQADQFAADVAAAFHENDTVEARVSGAVRTAVQRIAERQSPGSITEQPLFPGAKTTYPLPSAAAELQALVALRGEVGSAIYYAVRKARGEGVSWHDLAGLLDLPAEDGDDLCGRVSPGERAWYEMVPDNDRHNGGSTRPYFGYSCGACTKPIKDFGPFESHPADNEMGHADGCARYAEQVAAWQAKHRD